MIKNNNKTQDWKRFLGFLLVGVMPFLLPIIAVSLYLKFRKTPGTTEENPGPTENSDE